MTNKLIIVEGLPSTRRGENMFNKKKIVAYLIIFAVIVLGTILIQKNYLKEDIIQESISLEEYKKYDKYGFHYDDDEAMLYSFVAGLVDKGKLDLIHDSDDMDIYTSPNMNDWPMIIKKLPSCETLREVGFFIDFEENEIIMESYTIGYIDFNKDEISLTYFSDGTVHKSVYDTSLNQLVLVSNKLTKDVYYPHLR